MSTFHRMHCLAAIVLLSAAATAGAEPAAPAPAEQLSMPAATPGERMPQSEASAARPNERLSIGLSDSSTKLVLPWFITELTDAVNEGKSLGDTAKGLAQGL